MSLLATTIPASHVFSGICFVMGGLLLLLGVGLGTVQSRSAAAVTGDKVRTAQAAVKRAQAVAADLTTRGVSSAETPKKDDTAASAIQSKGDALDSAFNDLSSLISDFPENLRFPVLLILIGAALMSVGTVQFGGHSIF